MLVEAMEFVHCIKLWFMWKTAVRLVRSIDIDMRAYWDNCMQWQVVLLKNQRVSQEYGFHAMTQRNNSYAITKGHNCHAVTQGYNSHLVIRLSCILFLMQQSNYSFCWLFMIFLANNMLSSFPLLFEWVDNGHTIAKDQQTAICCLPAQKFNLLHSMQG